jgi:hypothetical protein
VRLAPRCSVLKSIVSNTTWHLQRSELTEHAASLLSSTPGSNRWCIFLYTHRGVQENTFHFDLSHEVAAVNVTHLSTESRLSNRSAARN